MIKYVVFCYTNYYFAKVAIGMIDSNWFKEKTLKIVLICSIVILVGMTLLFKFDTESFGGDSFCRSLFWILMRTVGLIVCLFFLSIGARITYVIRSRGRTTEYEH